MIASNKVVTATSSVLVLFCIFALTNGDQAKAVEGVHTYAINLTAEDPAVISEGGYGSGSKIIHDIQFDYYSVQDTPGYHTAIDAGGYIENPYEQITSIAWVTAVFTGGLTLYTGYEAGNCGNSYPLVSDVPQEILDDPYFLRIYADSATLLTSVEIRFRCEPFAPQLTFTLSGDSTYYIINSYSRIADDLTIPSFYNGKPVKEIAENAFSYNYSLRSVTIPSSVTTIGASAFEDCEALESITIPDSVTSIGNSAFYYCTSLTSFHIPSGLTSLSDYLFSEDEALTSVTIPSSVTTIGTETFSYCYSLETMTFESGSLLTSVGYHAFLDTLWLETQRADNPLVIVNHIVIDGLTATEDVIIPEGVTSINQYAFTDMDAYYGADIYSVSFPSTLTTIGQLAFSYCYYLETITFENESLLTSIGYGAFWSTPWLDYQRIDNPLVTFNHVVIDGIMMTGDVIIPDGITSINPYAFVDIDSSVGANITSVSFPSTLTTIGSSAFQYCGNLSSITFSTGLATIGQHAFEECGLSSLTLPDSITSIGEYAFQYNYSLEEVTLSSGLTRLSDYLFSNCTYLATITMKPGLTRIGQGVFDQCSWLNNVVIPSGVTSLGSFAFGNCAALDTISIPSSVTSIDYQAFESTPWLDFQRTLGNNVVIVNAIVLDGASATGDVTIAEGPTSIGGYSFRSNYNVTNLILPEGILSIGEYALADAGSLASIVLPSTVTEIGFAAFSNDASLTAVYYGGASATAWNAIADGGENTSLTDAPRYYYSASSASGCWHYDAGVPTLW